MIPTSRPRHGRKEACSIGWEERGQLHCSSDSRQPDTVQAKRTEVEARRRQQKGHISSTSQYSESEDSEGGHWKSKSRRQRLTRMHSHRQNLRWMWRSGSVHLNAISIWRKKQKVGNADMAKLLAPQSRPEKSIFIIETVRGEEEQNEFSRKGFKNKQDRTSGQAQDLPKAFSKTALSFPPLKEEDGAESPMIIEVEMGDILDIGLSGYHPTQCNYYRQDGIRKIRDRRIPSHSTRNVKNFPLKAALTSKIFLNNALAPRLLSFTDIGLEGGVLVDKHEIEPKEVHLRNAGRNVLRLQNEGRQIQVYFVKGKGAHSNEARNKSTILYGKVGVRLASASKRFGKILQAHTVKAYYDIQYDQGPQSIKGQILARFYCGTTDKEELSDESCRTGSTTERGVVHRGHPLIEARNRAGLILTNPEGAEFTYAMRFRFEATNNEAEYEALIAGLRIAEQMGVKNLQANVDSRLVAINVTAFLHRQESGMVQYFTQRLLLSTMHMDARNLIKECNDCQIHCPILSNPQQNLTPITSPWPFYKWGIDIAGPFPEGPGKVKFLIVAIDYFTKWIEAKAVATITGNQVKKFVWDNIVCRFGLPGEIISDNGECSSS
ncbi:reverse transcriptase domain-containing protein [Tanacetum coccineum]